MKALIVDDEEHVREAIELSVDWAKFGITERLTAEDGREALELVRAHRPAVLFCDMSMPKMDGTELLRLLREENEETQVIVVSGHDDYAYTRAAIRAWGVDYLLKPLRKADLEQALERAAAAWRRKESDRAGDRETAYRLKQSDALLEEQRLAAYLNGESPYHESSRVMLSKLGYPEGGIRTALILPRNRVELTAERFAGDGELFLFAVNNIAHEMLKPYGPYVFCRLDGYLWALLLPADGADSGSAGWRGNVRRLAEAWRRTIGLDAFVGLTDAAADIAGLPGAVRDARSSLLQATVYEAGSGEQPAVGGPAPKLSDLQLQLDAALQGGSRAYAAELVRGFARSLRARGTLSLKELQAYTLEANLLLERAGRRAAAAGKAPPELAMPLWVSDLDEWEKLLTARWERLVEEAGEGQAVDAAQSMRDYIDRHYREDISLASLSERFHFSPQYIAKKFKEAYDTTVVTYLTDRRMAEARSLLAHTALPAQEIALLVGYADENYFGKVFKRHTGLTPMQYRRNASGEEVPS